MRLPKSFPGGKTTSLLIAAIAIIGMTAGIGAYTYLNKTDSKPEIGHQDRQLDWQ